MSETPILVQNVSRSFDGPPVVNNLSLSVQPGSIYGFLGRNGSGKTTTLRMLVGLIKPHNGEIRIMGNDPFTIGAAERQWLGYMAEQSLIPPRVKVRSVLNLGRDLYPNWDAGLVDSLIAKYDLGLNKRFSTLSLGNQRLLSFIMAIAPRPKVLLLDEPAANLDVIARREILDEILNLARDSNCTVLFSTHILSDVERVANEVGILSKGTLLLSESLDSLKDSIRQVRFFGFTGSLPTGEIAESVRTVRNKEELTITLRINSSVTPETLADQWSCQYETRVLNLEDIFVEISST